MYVRSLHVENLRCFKSAEVELQFPGREQDSPPTLPNVNLLLGNNGAGKTTVLKAIALAVLAPIIEGSGYVPYRLVRRDSEANGTVQEARIEADLVLHPQDIRPGRFSEATKEFRSDLEIQRIRSQERLVPSGMGLEEVFVTVNELFDDESPSFLLVGYGATRYVVDASFFEPVASQMKRRRLRYQRVAGLFEDQLGLAPLISWLPRLQAGEPDRFEEITSLLRDLLPRDARFLGTMEDDEYLFEHCGTPVPLGALSDGYRAYIGWVSDLLYNISLGARQGIALRDARGVVLVDEIDLHLHPEWQREVVPTIARALPNLQFVLTTHSPIVAGTLTAKNIFLLEMDGAGASTIRQLTEPIHGLNADQILISSYFNLETTRASETVDELQQLSEKAMEGDSDAALAFLKKLSSGTEPSQ